LQSIYKIISPSLLLRNGTRQIWEGPRQNYLVYGLYSSGIRIKRSVVKKRICRLILAFIAKLPIFWKLFFQPTTRKHKRHCSRRIINRFTPNIEVILKKSENASDKNCKSTIVKTVRRKRKWKVMVLQFFFPRSSKRNIQGGWPFH